MTHQVRYDEAKAIYRDCRWCAGAGCLYCKAERDKDYARAFPDGPKPIATFNINDPDDMVKLREMFGPDALRAAPGSEDGGK